MKIISEIRRAHLYIYVLTGVASVITILQQITMLTYNRKHVYIPVNVNNMSIVYTASSHRLNRLSCT
jgi:hypothetical protein